MGSVKKFARKLGPVAPILASSFLGPMAGALVPSFGSGIMSQALRSALTQGLTNVGTQKLIGGKFDPRSALTSAVVGGAGTALSGIGNSAKAKNFFKTLSDDKKTLAGGKALEGRDRMAKLFYESAEKGGKALSPFETAKPGDRGFDLLKLKEGIDYKDVLAKATLDSTIGGSISAYDAAKKSEEEFDKMMAGKTRTAAEDKAERVARITDSMKAAGFPQSRIDEVLSREGYAANGGIMYRTGGRVGFAGGGGSHYYDTSTYMDLYDRYQDDILDGVIDIDMSFENWVQNRNESMMDDRYKKGGRVGFGDGGTSNRENSGIIAMEMIDPETGKKKKFFGSLYDETIMSGIITGSITPLESHPLLEGEKEEFLNIPSANPVSYTHLTLPTKRIV